MVLLQRIKSSSMLTPFLLVNEGTIVGDWSFEAEAGREVDEKRINFLYLSTILETRWSGIHPRWRVGSGLTVCDAVTLGELVPTFRKNLLFSSSKVKQNLTAYPLKMKTVPSFETSGSDHVTRRHIPEDLNFQKLWIKFFEMVNKFFIVICCFMYVLSNYMEQRPNWEANSSSAREKKSTPFMQPDVSL
jgi:hypothetical protein